LGVSLIIVSQMKMMKGMGDSVVAFYAADTGIERALYERPEANFSGSVGEANYNVYYEETGSQIKYKSIGSSRGVKRAIEISTPAPFDFSLAADPNYYCDCVGMGTDFCPKLDNSIIATIESDPQSGASRTFVFSYSVSPVGFTSCDFPTGNSCSATYPGSCSVTLSCNSYFTDGTVTVTATAILTTKSIDISASYFSLSCPSAW